jgi:hypothetical protein
MAAHNSDDASGALYDDADTRAATAEVVQHEEGDCNDAAAVRVDVVMRTPRPDIDANTLAA